MVFAQTDSLSRILESNMFWTNSEIGEYLNYNISSITQIRQQNIVGFKQYVQKVNGGFEVGFVYNDDAWHKDWFVYKINTDSLPKSEYLFYNNELDTTLGYFTTPSAYVVKTVDKTKMKFIDSINLILDDSLHTIYKFKTTHSIEDSNDVCMLHFLSPKLGLITRQSNIWWCTSASLVELPHEKGYCPFEDRNHFSLLNISNQHIEFEKFGKTIREERPNWVIRQLRTGIPPDSSILNFYNDTISCDCNYDALFRGYFEYLEYEKPNEGLTRKQIRKIGRKNKKCFRVR